jgi:5-hydroxyisourate hydrolase-like protein (transthyretin family)
MKMGSGVTDSQGHFSTRELSTGSYRLEFSTNDYSAADYMNEFYDEKSTLESADPVDIAAPADTAVNVTLDLGGGISGHVRDALTGTPLSDFNVVVLDTGKNEVRSLYTSIFGFYWARGLPAGTYYVNFFKQGVCSTKIFDLYYNQKPDLASADPVQVVLQGLHTGVDAFITQNYLFFPIIRR